LKDNVSLSQIIC